jgi:hypothetical protein
MKTQFWSRYIYKLIVHNIKLIIHRGPEHYRQKELFYIYPSIYIKSIRPVSIAERSKACTVYERLNIGIACSNPARGMDVPLRVSVLCCPVFR